VFTVLYSDLHSSLLALFAALLVFMHLCLHVIMLFLSFCLILPTTTTTTMFVYLNDDITRNLHVHWQNPPYRAALYTEGLSRLNCCHTRPTAVDNRIGLTS